MDFILPPEMRPISPIILGQQEEEEEQEEPTTVKLITMTEVVDEVVARQIRMAKQDLAAPEPLPPPPIPQNNVEEVTKTDVGEEESEQETHKNLQQSLDEASTMLRRQVLISAQEKYGQMAVIERESKGNRKGRPGRGRTATTLQGTRPHHVRTDSEQHHEAQCGQK